MRKAIKWTVITIEELNFCLYNIQFQLDLKIRFLREKHETGPGFEPRISRSLAWHS